MFAIIMSTHNHHYPLLHTKFNKTKNTLCCCLFHFSFVLFGFFGLVSPSLH